MLDFSAILGEVEEVKVTLDRGKSGGLLIIYDGIEVAVIDPENGMITALAIDDVDTTHLRCKSCELKNYSNSEMCHIAIKLA